ncbi:WASH complex subunit 2 [Zeugodacus cucurbitae]|uniref:WASH complex subunit 2 n=1 Tax=Zeugodacus cucurbitae TaxID=28588 RepID=UPI0023D8EAA2|nr:WASH complex subunit 2 [Zeugodacus cucurbitae]
MEENARADKIISQATQWSFEGDCSLLAWMQELSQHIEQRATKTNDALQQLNINVNRTAIALDNAANSLTALQYTQFVESRCHDDDETQTTTNVVDTEAAATSTAKTKTPKEVLETFLQKNLQMLHNCHEKYALDFEDSDEDEATNTNNYIYQPKNPYNDALLPHIYGSKLWKEHWHVGLCDGANEYSGDEASDAFSETSSSSAADNESYESNTANLSEWASSTSIPIEHKHPALMVAPKEHTLPVTAATASRNKHLPSTQPVQSNDDSDTYSTTSRSTATNPPHRAHEHDLFAALRHDTPITSSTTSSSPQQHAAATAQTQRVIPSTAASRTPFFDVTPPTDIFADAVTEPQPTNRGENITVQQKSTTGQIKRKPVNLFDDDDFNSFMTEVVDKAQNKAVQEEKVQPVPASRTLPSRRETTKVVDLFAEPPSIQKPVTAPIKIEKPKETTTRKPVNLFDSPEGSLENDSLFKNTIPSDNKAKDVAPTVAEPSITAKSLFDDDDDDDDFLNAFGARKLNLPQRTAGKTLLFDDDNEAVTRPPMNTRTTVNLFDDTPPEDDFTQTTAVFKEKNNNKKSNDSLTVNGSVGKELDQSNETAKTEAAVVTNTTTTKTSSETASNSQLPQPPPLKPVSKLFGTDLFADDDNDDLDDLFNKNSTKQQTTKTVNNESSNKVQENVTTTNVITPQKNSLFGDDFVDDEDDDLFGSQAKKVDKHLVAPTKSNQSAVSTFKSSSLFGDDLDDDADDLFGIKSIKKVSKNEPKIASTTAAVVKDNTHVLLEQNEDKSSSKQAKETEVFETVKNASPRKSLFEDDDFENTNDLFGPAKKDALSSVEKVAEENLGSNGILDQIQAATSVSEPPPLDTVFEKESAALEPTPINGLFSDNFESVSEQESEKSRKTPISDITVEQIVVSDENNVENIENNVAQEKNSAPDSLSSPHKGIPNNEEIKEVETLAETSHHEDNNLENQLDSWSKNAERPEKLETPQPTLESLEETMETSDDVVKPPADTNKDVAPDKENTSNQPKYTSIFLEEPPDDDDFFATLSSNTKPLSVSKLTLDLENDFYEPALPQVPTSARSTTTAATTNTQAGTSDYGGLRLFSEIPPDDYDEDDNFNTAKQQSKQAADNGVGVNQRLHSVFYDDFTETLEAVQQIKENKIAAHALFDDEPPSDEELFAVRAMETPKNLVETKTEEDSYKIEGVEPKDENFVKNVSKVEPTKDVTDRVVPKLAYTATAPPPDNFGKTISKAEPSKDLTDRAIPKLENTTTAPPPEKPRAVAGKLQMPNIKINVQALLPGGGGRPNFKKSPTTPVVPIPTQTQSEASVPSPAAELSKPTSSVSLKSTASAASTNDSLLPSVCKTRVRAPVGRRPSTRRARQENYRQSLIAEQTDHIVGDFDAEGASSSSVITGKLANQTESDARNAQPAPSSVPKAPAVNASVNLAKSANLFLDEDDDAHDYDSLFKPAQVSSNNSKQALNVKTVKGISVQRPAMPASSASETPTTLLAKKVDFAGSDADDDDDLFKSVRVAPTSAASKPTNNSKAATTTATTQSIPPTKPTTKSLFGNTPSEDSDDDLFKSSKSLPRITTKAASPLTTTTETPTATGSRVTETPKTTNERKLDSIFGSDDEDDDFLSNLKPKKKAITSLVNASAGSSAKQSSAGLFSDVESDEDDLFGVKSKSKPITSKSKATLTTMTSTSTKQKPITTTTTTKQQPLDKQKSLSDNPLADLLNP